MPPVRAGAHHTALGGDHEAVPVRVQGLGDQLLGQVRAVVVGGVDQGDPALDRGVQQGPGLGAAAARAPEAGADQTARTQTEPPYGEVAAEPEHVVHHDPTVTQDAGCARLLAMRYIIIGAGAIGAAIGGRLAGAGSEVVLVARGAHAEALRADGLRLTTADGPRVHRLPVVTGPAELGELRPDDVLLLAVKTQDAIAALDAWGDAEVAGGGTAAQRLPVLCAQNGVESERLALRRFARVYGVCVWLPATFLEPGVVSALCAPLTGILHLGPAAGGTPDARARRIAADLEEAGFEAPVVEDVMRWKYAKLLGNLGNAIQATTGPEPDPAKAALLLRARREGEAVLDAAGIAYASGAEEAAARDGKVAQPPGLRGGSSWQSLRRGTGSIEADYLNGEVCLLGRLHGIPTPVNETLRHAANIFARQGLPPGAMPIADLTALADEAAARP